MKYPPGTIINLNQADTTELKRVPGTRSRIIRSIVSRRQSLREFYQIEQLGETRLKAEELRLWFSVDVGRIHRISTSRTSVEWMVHHPYVSYYQAKVTAEYRKKKGKVRDLEQLMFREEPTPVDFERMAPYVCYDQDHICCGIQKKMYSYHTRQEYITHKQSKHSTDIFADLRREATISIQLKD